MHLAVADKEDEPGIEEEGQLPTNQPPQFFEEFQSVDQLLGDVETQSFEQSQQLSDASQWVFLYLFQQVNQLLERGILQPVQEFLGQLQKFQQLVKFLQDFVLVEIVWNLQAQLDQVLQEVSQTLY